MTQGWGAGDAIAPPTFLKMGRKVALSTPNISDWFLMHQKDQPSLSLSLKKIIFSLPPMLIEKRVAESSTRVLQGQSRS